MSLKRQANRLLPRHWIKFLRNAVLSLADGYDRLRGGGADGLTPPRSLHFIGGGDFKAIGREFFGYFRTLCGVQPHHNILDIGCGTGRMAVPFLEYLDPAGSYTGFDISRRAIDWCNRRIAAERSNFKFFHADIYNREYNPRGTLMATDYRFPCEDATMDLVFATSVFTHMFPDGIGHYLSEIRRVLKPNGCCLLTYYLLNDETATLTAGGRALFTFNVALPGCYSVDAKTPERAIALAEESVRGLHRQAGLPIREPIYFGGWCGRRVYSSSQDIVIAGKG